MAFLDSNKDGYEEIQIPVPWGYVAGKWWGPRDLQPILSIHGKQDNAGSFDPLARALQKHNVSILCIDLPGHGLSSHYPKGVFYNFLCDAVYTIRRIVKHFGWASKLTLMGHSLGGGIAYIYSAIFCDEVQKMIGLDCMSPPPENILDIIQDLPTSVDKLLELELTDNEKSHYEYEDIRDMIMESRYNALNSTALKALINRSIKPSQDDEDCYEFCKDSRLNYAQGSMMTKTNILNSSFRLTCKLLLIIPKNGIMVHDFTDVWLEELKNREIYVKEHVVHGNHYVHLNNPSAVLPHIVNFLKQ